MKTCNTCKVEKPLTEFYPVRRTTKKIYYKSFCKVCDKEKHKEWKKKNHNRMNELVKNSYYKTKDDHFSVYLLPDHNYVGQTQNVADRKRKHRNYHNRNVDNIQILHKFNTREEALAKEAEYHNMGYAGAK